MTRPTAFRALFIAALSDSSGQFHSGEQVGGDALRAGVGALRFGVGGGADVARKTHMTDAEWMTCDHPIPMLAILRGKASDRKLRLFAVACCRRSWEVLEEECGRQAVEVRRTHRHDALVIGADIGPADVIAHDHDDVGLLA